MSTKLKAVEKKNEEMEEGPQAKECTEELPRLRVEPASFDARIAGVGPAPAAREFAKHRRHAAAYQVERARNRGEVQEQSYAESERLHQEAWEREWQERPDDLAEYVELIKSKAAQHRDWGDIGQVW